MKRFTVPLCDRDRRQALVNSPAGLTSDRYSKVSRLDQGQLVDGKHAVFQRGSPPVSSHLFMMGSSFPADGSHPTVCRNDNMPQRQSRVS